MAISLAYQHTALHHLPASSGTSLQSSSRPLAARALVDMVIVMVCAGTGLDGMPPGMAKLDSLDLTGIDGGMLLQDLAVEQQRALGLHGGVPFMNRQNSGLQSMQSIEHALGGVEQVSFSPPGRRLISKLTMCLTERACWKHWPPADCRSLKMCVPV